MATRLPNRRRKASARHRLWPLWLGLCILVALSILPFNRVSADGDTSSDCPGTGGGSGECYVENGDCDPNKTYPYTSAWTWKSHGDATAENTSDTVCSGAELTASAYVVNLNVTPGKKERDKYKCEDGTEYKLTPPEQADAAYLATAYRWADNSSSIITVTTSTTLLLEVEITCTDPDVGGPSTWVTIASVTIDVMDGDSISITQAPMLVSVNQTVISITANVSCNGSPASGVSVSFSSNDLTFTGGSSATTDSNGNATVTAAANSTPSSAEGSTYVTASIDNGLGNTYDDTTYLTVIEVNSPTPSNPTILDGHYSDDSLYSTLMTFTVTPAISGVSITFEFTSGGDGVNHPAALEDADSSTDSSGEATVRVRSSDLRETVTVAGTFEESSSNTDVIFTGIDTLETH